MSLVTRGIGFGSSFMSFLSKSATRSGRQFTPRGSTTTANYLSTTSKVSDIFNVQDEADFKEKVLKSKKPVVVDFHATWCGPCKTLMPRLETIVGSTKDGVNLAKVDIDNLPEIAMEYGVGAVPSVLSFKNGEIKDKFVGVRDEDEIQKFVDNLRK